MSQLSSCSLKIASELIDPAGEGPRQREVEGARSGPEQRHVQRLGALTLPS
jgi:hypothetical protein